LPSTTLSGQDSNIIQFLDRILDKGIVINGDITVFIAGVELLSIKLNLVIASLETAKRYGLELPWEKWQSKKEIEDQDNENENKNKNKNKTIRRKEKRLNEVS
jgi:hypothetical protein